MMVEMADPKPGLVDIGRLLTRYWRRVAELSATRLFLLRQKLRWRSGEVRRAYRRAGNVLFVCYGNINRSPLAEALLGRRRGAFAGGWVRSAGFHPQPDRRVDPRMQALARERGVDLANLRSRRLDARLIAEADIVFVMEKNHYDRLVALCPDAAAKTYLLGGAPGVAKPEIADPYNRSPEAYAACYAAVDRAIAGLEGRGGAVYAAPGNS